MTNFAYLFLMGQPGGAAGQTNPLLSFLPLILVFVVFYFFMIRPQMKKQKELTSFRNTLKRGDSVLTTGGIYGRVFDIKDQYVVIEVDEKVKMKIDKAAIMKDPADLANK